jgi:GNAT superfamily N-acetyltransferase
MWHRNYPRLQATVPNPVGVDVMSELTLKQVMGKQDLNRFIRVPWALYRDDPAWVPPLMQQVKERLSPRHNPYFDHADAAYFLAERDGRPVGRLSAQVCQLVQEYQGAGIGHFGMFECEDRQETADALFEAGSQWLRKNEMRRVMGPVDLSINDEIGMLVEGFERPPCVMMGHHLSYYKALVEQAGFKKEIDLFAYYKDIFEPFSERIERIMKWASSEVNMSIRAVARKDYDRELRNVLDIFRDAWCENWGYVPPTDAEVDHLIKQMRQVLDRGAVLLSEIDGELAGFIVVLPDVNEYLHDLDGRLAPLGWLRLLMRLKFSTCETVRVPLMGVRKKFQRTRVGAAVALALIDTLRNEHMPSGAKYCEMSWILETNSPMRGIMESAGCKCDKVYRVFSKDL